MCAGEGDGDRARDCVRVSPQRRGEGRRWNGDVGPNEWLVLYRRDAMVVVWLFLSSACSPSEVRMDVSRGAVWGCRVDLKQAVVVMAVLGGWATDGQAGQ